MSYEDIEKEFGNVLTMVYNLQTKLSKLRGELYDERNKTEVINTSEPYGDTV